MSSICIHVLNVGQGDSIVLDFTATRGKTMWGLIDCYETKNRTRTSPFEFLKKRKVAAFVCLTHPHLDHYRGMLRILEHFSRDDRRIEEFWHFGLDTDVLEFLGGRSNKKKRHGELRRLNAFLFRKKPERKVNYDYFSKNWQRSLGSKRGSMTIKALSLISDNIVEDLRKSEGTTRARKNRLSVALAIMFRNKNILLGADIDAYCWHEIMDQWRQYCNSTGRNRKFDFIKVSHHGSKDGNVEELWKNLSKGDKTVAVISTGCKGEMPHPETLETILRNGVKLYSTNLWDFSAIAPSGRSARNFQQRGCITRTALKELSGLFEAKHCLEELRKERLISSNVFKVLMVQLQKQLQSLAPCHPYYHGTCSMTLIESGACEVVTQSGKPPISMC